MHCSAAIEAPAGGSKDGELRGDTAGTETGANDESARAGDPLLDPDGALDDVLGTVVGVAGGLVVGVVGTAVLSILTGSVWGVGAGVLGWLAATRHLVKQPSVTRTISRAGYGVALALVLVPLVAFAPSSDGTSLPTRAVVFVSLLAAAVVPAGVAASVAYAVERFAPDGKPRE
jgi:hypothetical protein